MLAKLRGMTKHNKGASKSASDVEEPEEKATESSAEPATEPAASAKNAKKKLSPLQRLKAGLTSKKSVKAGSHIPTDDSKETGINPPKKKRGRKPAVTATGAESKEPESTTSSKETAKPVRAAAKSKKTKKVLKIEATMLLIGCYPVQGFEAPVQLHELLVDVKAAVCEANGVTYWDFLEYSKGSAALAHALDAKLTEEGVPPLLYAEPFSSESRAVEQVLLKHYGVVIRGLR